MRSEQEQVVVSWSGGIDSTALAAALINRGYRVKLVSLNLYDEAMPRFALREAEARAALGPFLSALAVKSKAAPPVYVQDDEAAPVINAFRSPDGEIPLRNHRIIDYLVARHCIPAGTKSLGLGEYIGADSWVVQDHVDARDADARALTSYVLHEYGLSWRLFTMADFRHETRFKVDRVQMLVEELGLRGAQRTTNCLADSSAHCGRCYKCTERAVAFAAGGHVDTTEYDEDPRRSGRWAAYLKQMGVGG